MAESFGAPYRYLLDTNIISALVRHPKGTAAARIAHVGEDTVCTSLVVVCELRFGAAKKASQRLSTQLERVLSGIEILPLDEPADRRYADLRAHLDKAGTPLGANDYLIAAHALALGLTLVTDNLREFTRVPVPGLVVENWLAP